MAFRKSSKPYIALTLGIISTAASSYFFVDKKMEEPLLVTIEAAQETIIQPKSENTQTLIALHQNKK